ncbi:hypothetical protein QM806_33695 [Rhodococcus sp. IEGM 1351]|uniref:hypothetical protein n=1 Tax=Rhodococcus sp. IEGM 1351 TaxID=3047089 RepID=UPI0024B67795|nr:hypothetical protein [Rhodococcus sp. IEGM 1351]MDI9940330.1 hypothetical protein [Rhodococcus sp. IEGM 1351]
MTNFPALYGGALESAPADTESRLRTIEGVVEFIGPWAGFLMMLGGIAALVGSISSPGVG